MPVLIMRENMLFYEEIYTAGKNFTLLTAVLAVTSLTSGWAQPEYIMYENTLRLHSVFSETVFHLSASGSVSATVNF